VASSSGFNLSFLCSSSRACISLSDYAPPSSAAGSRLISAQCRAASREGANLWRAPSAGTRARRARHLGHRRSQFAVADDHLVHDIEFAVVSALLCLQNSQLLHPAQELRARQAAGLVTYGTRATRAAALGARAMRTASFSPHVWWSVLDAVSRSDTSERCDGREPDRTCGFPNLGWIRERAYEDFVGRRRYLFFKW